jgi:hypothetical protein
MTTTPRTAPHATEAGRARLADVRSRLPRTLTSGLDSLRDEMGRQLADPTPAYAALGAGEVVARRVGEAARHGAALAQRVRRDGGAEAGHLPRLAVGRALTLAGKVEETYGEMAARGRDVARRARDGRSTSELVRLAVLTLDRARRAGEERRPTVVVGETVPAASEPAPAGRPGGEPAGEAPVPPVAEATGKASAKANGKASAKAGERGAKAAGEPGAKAAGEPGAKAAAKPGRTAKPAAADTARRTAARSTAAKAGSPDADADATGTASA